MSVTEEYGRNAEEYQKSDEIVEEIFKTPDLQNYFDELEYADMFAYDDIDYADSIELQPVNALTVMNLKDCDWERGLRIAELSPPKQARNRDKIHLSAGWCPLLAKLASIETEDYTFDVLQQSLLPHGVKSSAEDRVLKQLVKSVAFESKAHVLPAGHYGSEVEMRSARNFQNFNFKVIRSSNVSSTLCEQYNFSFSAHIFQNFLTLYHCDICLAACIERPLRTLTILAPKLSTHVQLCAVNNSNVGASVKLALQQLRPVAYSSTEFAAKCKFTTNIN